MKISFRSILLKKNLAIVTVSLAVLTFTYAFISLSMVSSYRKLSLRAVEGVLVSLVNHFNERLEFLERSTSEQLESLMTQLRSNPTESERLLRDFVQSKSEGSGETCHFSEVPRAELPEDVAKVLSNDFDFVLRVRFVPSGFEKYVFLRVQDRYFRIVYGTSSSEVLRIAEVAEAFPVGHIRSLEVLTVDFKTVYSYRFDPDVSPDSSRPQAEELKFKLLRRAALEQRVQFRLSYNQLFVAGPLVPSKARGFVPPMLYYAEVNIREVVLPLSLGFLAFLATTLVALLLSYRLSKRTAYVLSQPFEHIVKSMEVFSESGTCTGVDLPDFEIVEFSKLAEAYTTMTTKLAEAMSQLRMTNAELETAYQEVQRLSAEVEVSYLNFARQLAVIAESYDETTGNHIERVGELAAFIAKKYGLPDDVVEKIRTYAPLHDIGKILVPKELLTKAGRLSEEEFEMVKLHPVHGARIIGDSEHFRIARNIALYHHERWDGSGYPFGLKGDEIPIEARIVAVVDVYDALRSERPYKKALTHEEAMRIILEGDGRTSPGHFDPVVLDILKTYGDELKSLWEEVYASTDFAKV